MIIQGTNDPIVITFDEGVSEIKEWSISLYSEDKRGAPGELMKHWGTDDITIEGTYVIAPITEGESMDFIPCVASLEIKWLSNEDLIFHSDVVRIRVCGRKDKTMLTGSTDDAEQQEQG